MTTESAARVDPEARAAWSAAVGAVLAKARKVDAAELGEHPERRLETTTADGITLAALYTPDDEGPELAPPGVFPYTRGARTGLGWDVRVPHTVAGDPAVLNRAVLTDLENGATSLWLTVDAETAGDLEAALAGVFLDLAPVVLDPGEHLAAAGRAFLALLEHTDADLAQVRAHLGADPVTVLLRTGVDLGVEAVELAQQAAAHSAPLRSITVDGTVFHESGASTAQELGAVLAGVVHHLRLLTDAGLDVDAALGQLEVRLSATDDQFTTLAAMRAARRCVARVARASGASTEASRVPQHAVTSAAMMTQRDPWVNMLRTTLAAFGAGVGGADAVTVRPFDAALPGGAPGVAPEFAARIARNTQLLLLEESHLGRVLDAGGGSYYLEHLTDALARAAWSELQRIEGDGGLLVGLDALQARIAEVRARRAADVAHRRLPITGVSEFPNLADPAPSAPTPAPGAWALHRWAAGFEALRDRADAAGERPEALLVPLGPIAEHNGRTGFATTLLAAGGISAHDPGPLAPDDVAAAAAGHRVAVVCGSDRRYADEAAAAVTALREAGVARVLLAGAERVWTFDAAGPDGFVGLGSDAVAVLTDLLDALEVPR